jgi:hypothetical protein
VCCSPGRGSGRGFAGVDVAVTAQGAAISAMVNCRALYIRWAIASSVAVRRGSANAASVGALLANPYRANAATRWGGTFEQSADRTPSPARSAARSSAVTRPGPDTRVGARRQDSISDNRAPGGTPNDARNRPGSAGSTSRAAAASAACIRSAAASRTVTTNRISTVIPGNSTPARRNHPTPWVNRAPGPSTCVGRH